MRKQCLFSNNWEKSAETISEKILMRKLGFLTALERHISFSEDFTEALYVLQKGTEVPQKYAEMGAV